MRREDALGRAVEARRHRPSRFSAASRRVNASLDCATVLPGVLDAARPLTGARYGLSTRLDDATAGQPPLRHEGTGGAAGSRAGRWGATLRLRERPAVSAAGLSPTGQSAVHT
ncbi:MAG: hypothetical protein OXU67_02905 [Chloroflexota bacterium]|nr:hypothetical protein [Chloroflexota bacterium]